MQSLTTSVDLVRKIFLKLVRSTLVDDSQIFKLRKLDCVTLPRIVIILLRCAAGLTAAYHVSTRRRHLLLLRLRHQLKQRTKVCGYDRGTRLAW